ncbi:MAG: MFS transporter [Thermoplasmata archaeon]
MVAPSTGSGAPPPTGPRRTLSLNPAFRFLLGSTTTSALGGSITGVSLSWLIYHFTGSTLDVAYLGITGVLPGIVLGLLAGVLADRYDRRTLMVASDTVRALAMMGLALALYLVGFSLLLVLGVMTLVYSFSALFYPASQAILPRLVPKRQLEDANGVLSASSQIGYTVGSAAGGLAIAFVGALAGLGVNAATYAVSALLLLQIAPEFGRARDGGSAPTRSIRGELVEGLAYMRNHLPVLEVTLGFLPASLFFPVVTNFFVVYAAVVLGPSPALFGYLVAALTAGAAAGAVSVGRLRARRFAGLAMGVGLMVTSGATVLLVLASSLLGALSGAAILGFSMGLIGTIYYSTMQVIVPDEVLARVLSIDMVGSLVAVPAGLILGGLLSSSHGILFAYTWAAIGFLVTGFLFLALPGIRSLRYVEPPAVGGAARPG